MNVMNFNKIKTLIVFILTYEDITSIKHIKFVKFQLFFENLHIFVDNVLNVSQIKINHRTNHANIFLD
jgi:hypothetical protein